MEKIDSTCRRAGPLALFAFLVFVTAAAAAAAEPRWIIKQNERHGLWSATPTVSVMPWYFAPGVRLGIPLLADGFIQTVNDEAKVEVGGNFQLWWHPAWRTRRCETACDPSGDLFFRLGLPVMLRWEFYLTKVWSLYVAFGLELGIPFERVQWDPFGPDDWFWIVAVLGTRFTIQRSIAIRLETGSIGLLVFGLELLF